MVFINRFTQVFPFKTNQIIYPALAMQKKYAVVIFPENITFQDVYSSLLIRKSDVRYVFTLPSIIPKIYMNATLLKVYKSTGLIPSLKTNIANNIIIDASPFLEGVQRQFKPTTYRSGLANKKIKFYLDQVQAATSDKKSVLLYCIDINKDFPKDIYSRKIYPLIEEIFLSKTVPFDYFILGVIKNSRVTYFALSTPENKSIPATRMLQILRSVQTIFTDSTEFDETSSAAEDLVASLDTSETHEEVVQRQAEKQQDPIYKETQKGLVNVHDIKTSYYTDHSQYGVLVNAVQAYLKMNPALLKNMTNKDLSREDKAKIATKSILNKLTSNKKEINRAVENQINSVALYNQVRKDLLKDVITRDVMQNQSREGLTKSVDLNSINKYQDPSHLMKKRHIDFENSFERDLRDTFKLFAKKPDFPLFLDSIVIKDSLVDPGDLDPTYEQLYEITLHDELKRKQSFVIRIPKLMPDGTFTINGKKKFLVYQIVLEPIFFLKLYIAKLETLYAAAAIESRQLKSKQFFNIRIAGQTLPLCLLMSYYLGFNEGCKLFNIKYRIEEAKPEKGVYYLPLKDGFIIPEFKDEYQRQYLESFKEVPYKFEQKNLLEKKAWEDALVDISGNRNSPYSVSQVLLHIMEPISVQILKSKLLPITFEGCILYICKELINKRVDARNDISHQRIRSSEVFNHQILKQIIRAYNIYRAQRVSRNKDAVYSPDTDRVVSDILNKTKLVRNLENVNPIEEISCFTRITPIGPGGVPDKNAISESARGTHSTYYGNIDPMDTPEGDSVGVINQLAMGAAITNSRGSFVIDASEKMAGLLGTSSALVPFVNSNDGNRIQFGCSQSRQFVSIVENEPPIVQTGYETILTNLLSDNYIKKSPFDGKVTSITENVIIVRPAKAGKLARIALTPMILNSAQGQSAINTFRSVVQVGQTVKQGQILAEGKHLINGTISTGRNLLVAIMGWKGYVFEDGYVINDKLVKQLGSNHYFEATLTVKKGDKVRFIAPEGKDTIKGEPLLVMVPKDIEEIVGLSEDEMVGGERRVKSPGGKILSVEIYPNISIKNFPVLEEPFLKFKKKYEETKGPLPTKFIKKIGYEKLAVSGVVIVFKMEDHYPAILGDKLANRHGNKGVITHIEKDENMPRTPWGDTVDIIYNPLSIIGRMNPGQIYEMYIGLISKFAAKQLVTWGPKKTKKAADYIIKLYKLLDNTKGKKYSSDIEKSIMMMSSKKYADFINNMKERHNFLPVIVPQFQTPTRAQIKLAMNFVGVKNDYSLFLPEYGKNTIRPVAVGYMYFSKLEQQASIKLAARSTATYNSKTNQPLSGKKREGGQRMGEADVQMLLCHGVTNTLKEFMGPLSDDRVTKEQIISEVVERGEAKYREPKTAPTRDLLYVYMTSLGLES